jgi:hypothetical protein
MFRRIVVVGGFFLFLISTARAAKPATTQPELPRKLVDTRMPAVRGKVIPVAANADLQAALKNAQPGDTIVLQAGAVYTGTFTLPRKNGDGWIIIGTSAGNQLPPPGTRVTPQHARLMPRLVTQHNNEPALRAEAGASHYRIIGIEFTALPQVKQVSAIVELSHQGDVKDVPSDIIFDRVYIHGNPQLNSQRGLTLNAASCAIIDSWVDECHIHGADSQAIIAWDSPGPLKIENNFLEGGAENIMFGGAKNSAPTMVPSDIEIRRNHLYKNPKWFGLKYPNNWVIKNLFEIKTARRVLLEGNVLENCWAEGQTGFAFVLKSSSEDQGQPWDTTSDLTIRYNRIINSLNGVAITRWSSAGPVAESAEPTSRILFEHNVFEQFGPESDFGKGAGESAGELLQVAGRDITFRHNTAWCGHTMAVLTKEGTDNLLLLDNLLTPGSYGIHPDGGRAGGWNGGMETHLRGNSRMAGNTIIRVGTERASNIQPSAFPKENHWFDSFEAAGVDAKTYRLLPQSKAKRTASDGKDPGADIDAIMKATAGVRSKRP